MKKILVALMLMGSIVTGTALAATHTGACCNGGTAPCCAEEAACCK